MPASRFSGVFHLLLVPNFPVPMLVWILWSMDIWALREAMNGLQPSLCGLRTFVWSLERLGSEEAEAAKTVVKTF